MSADDLLRAVPAALGLVRDLLALGRDPEEYIARLRDADPELARIRAERDAALDARFPKGGE
jgi:hypothetical protein